MAKENKTDISPENVGELFLKPGEDVPYRLVRCESEPRAYMVNVGNIGDAAVEAYISEYKDYVLLKPVREIMSPRKPRADKGGKHAIPKKANPAVVAGICPTHGAALLRYEREGGTVLQCPQTNCEYEVEVK